MPSFAYQAIDAVTGRERKGTVEGATAEQASAALKGKGLAPVWLKPASPAGASGVTAAQVAGRSLTGGKKDVGSARATTRKPTRVLFGRVVTAKRLAVFTRQLATLIEAGMPLLRAVEVLARQENKPEFRWVLEEIADAIRSGGSLSQALERHPRIFDRLYLSMARAGEAGGVLAAVLDRVAVFLEKAERVRGRIKAAMMYPAIVMLVAGGIVAGLMVFVVPKFEAIFAGLLKGQPLPTLTQAVLAASEFVQRQWLLSLLLVAAAAVAFTMVRRTPRGARWMDGIALRIPVLGDLALKGAVARFTRTFGTLLSSGVPMLQALAITRDACGNLRVAEAIDFVHDRVKQGDGVARPLNASGVFPSMATGMIEVGEETGALPEMLMRVADAFDEEVDQAVAGLTTLIEPAMIVVLAAVVGTIVVALFLPIVSIIQHLQ